MLGWLIAAANPGKFMRRLPAALASLLIMLAVPAAAQTLRIGLQEDPDTLDGAKNWSFVGRNVMTSICDKLVDIAPDASIVPMLATGWETSADGKAITFKLRPGVRFHDGEPFDAAAVKFSLDRALTLPDSRRKSDKLAVSAITGLGYQGITFNIANGPRAANPFGRDKRVRAALDLAIDRKILNEVVNGGEFQIGNQAVPPTSFYYDQALPVPPRDVAGAKALLKEAGVTNPTITLLVPNADGDRQSAEVIQSMAREAGIEVKVQLTEFITMLQQAHDGTFDADYVGWSGRIDPDANIHTLLGCKVPGNDGHYCNQEIETLLQAARLTGDRDARKKAYEGVARILADERPIIYLWHQKWIWGLSADLKGYVPYPDGLIRLRDVKYKSGRM